VLYGVLVLCMTSILIGWSEVVIIAYFLYVALSLNTGTEANLGSLVVYVQID